jgi:hypothetical protein
MDLRKGPHDGVRFTSHPSLCWSNWNLLLLVPLLVLFTPLFGSDKPRLFGFPYFYWSQFLFIPLDVVSVAVMYFTTKHIGVPIDHNTAERPRR